MKKIFFILTFLVLTIFVKAQFPIGATSGTPNSGVLIRGRGVADSLFQINSTCFADTSVANRGVIDQIAGGMIRTCDDKIWVRNEAKTRWIEQVAGSGVAQCGLRNGGFVAWDSLLVFNVSPAVYCINNEEYSSPQTNVTLAAANPTNPRIDIIALDATGVIVIQGTAAASPSEPNVLPTQIRLVSVLVNAAATTPNGIDSVIIYDENVEWATSASGVTVDYNNFTSPFHFVKAASSGAVTQASTFIFTNTSDITVTGYSALTFMVNLKAEFDNNTQISVYWGNSLDQKICQPLNISSGNYGFTRTTVGSYQRITIPLSAFAFEAISARKLYIQLTGSNASGLYIDYIRLESGLTQPANSGKYIWNQYAERQDAQAWFKDLKLRTLLIASEDSAFYPWMPDNLTGAWATLQGKLFQLQDIDTVTAANDDWPYAVNVNALVSRITRLVPDRYSGYRHNFNASQNYEASMNRTQGVYSLGGDTGGGIYGRIHVTDKAGQNTGNKLINGGSVYFDGVPVIVAMLEVSPKSEAVGTSTRRLGGYWTGINSYVNIANGDSIDHHVSYQIGRYYGANTRFKSSTGFYNNIDQNATVIPLNWNMYSPDALSHSYNLFGGRVGIGGFGFGTHDAPTYHSSAALQINSNDRGFITSRMTAAQRLAISSPDTALFVWDSDSSRFMGYTSGAWKGIAWTSEAGGSGTVTSFSSGNLSPLFTTSVANATTTPALSFTLSNAGAYSVFGNPTSSSGAPSYTSNPITSSFGLAGSSSGVITIQPQAAAGTFNFNLPTTAGTSGYLLTSGGGGATAMTWTDPATVGKTYTASEGITLSTLDFQLGGTVSTDRTLTLGANTILITANTLAADPALSITSTSTAAASNLQKGINVSLSGANATASQATYGIYVANTHTGTSPTNYGIYSTTSGSAGYGVWGENTSSGVAVYGNSTSGYGVYGTSSGIAVAGSSSGSYAGYFLGNSRTNNTTSVLLTLDNTSSGTPATGFGSSIQYQSWVDNFNTRVSNQLISKWTNVTDATRTSQFIITGVNSATTFNLLTLDGNGLATFGVAGTNKGSIALTGNTSGTITIQPAAAAGTYTLTLPTTDGAASEFLQTDGNGVLTWAAAGGGSSTWNGITNPTGTQTLSFDDAELTSHTNGSDTETFWTTTSNSLTTGTVYSFTTSSMTTGNLINLSSTSTALAAGNELLNISVSGANGTNGITATGARISVTNTNATSGTNTALVLTASGATTANNAIEVTAGRSLFPAGTSTAPSAFIGTIGLFDFIGTDLGIYASSDFRASIGLSGVIVGNESGGFTIGHPSFSTTNRFHITAPAVGTMQLGMASTQQAMIFKGANNSGTNAAAFSMTLQSGAGTGNATTGGEIFLSTSDATGSGTTVQSYTTKFTVNKNGSLRANLYGAGTFTGTAAKSLAVDASGNIIEEAPISSSAWLLTGNSITAGTHFMGTTNNTSVVFKSNNVKLFMIDSSGFNIGYNSDANPYKMGGTTQVDMTTVGNVGTGEDNLMVYTVPANQLTNDGDRLEIEMVFDCAANANTKTIKIYWGSTATYTIPPFGTSGTDVIVRMTVVRDVANGQRISITYQSDNGTSQLTGALYATDNETDTGTITLKATGEGTANNDITQTLLTVKYFPFYIAL